MRHPIRMLNRCLQILCWSCLALGPLWAQLEPKLQKGTSDLLDLYLPPTPVKVKPELLSILDFCGRNKDMSHHRMFKPHRTDELITSPGKPWAIRFFLTTSSTVECQMGDLDSFILRGQGNNPLSADHSLIDKLIKPALTQGSGGAGTSGHCLIGKLIKPNGSSVESSDAAAADKASGLRYAKEGADSVVNWVRAASHVRFSTKVGSITRTVDVPIPWKIMDGNSSGNPLSSLTVLDKQVKAGESYGSGLSIEMDTCYRHEDVDFSQYDGGASDPPTEFWDFDSIVQNSFMTDRPTRSKTDKQAIWFWNARYTSKYLGWLLAGVYQSDDATKPYYVLPESNLAGKFIIFDAINPNLAGGQSDVRWGQGFGPAGA